ncbi:MAG TPA: diiron oxygenase [Polyangiales bacterium]
MEQAIALEPEPTQRAAQSRSYRQRVEQLSKSSVQKYYRAFHDIEWDAAENQIERSDPRLELRPDSPLGESAWYRAQAPTVRAELGLEMACQVLKFGIGFESVLSRGLLEYAGTLDNRSPERRYVLHEVIEECQHSLMFQELIDRSGSDPAPVGRLPAFIDRRIARCGATFPELFFFAVLSGELFIDAENRAQLRTATHPLLRRILHIHITEEARHVRFAQLYLERSLPALSAARTRFLRWVMPTMLRDAQRLMLSPTPRLQGHYRIPRAVMLECYGPGSRHRQQVEHIAAPIFALLGDPGRALRVFA